MVHFRSGMSGYIRSGSHAPAWEAVPSHAEYGNQNGTFLVL